MKYVLLLGLLLAGNAQAACFNFVNGKGPDRLGNVFFAAPATEVCVTQVSRFGGGSYLTVGFSDAEGALGMFAAVVRAVGRCPGFCQVLELQSGNANGMNVNPSGIQLEFQAEPQQNLGGFLTGTLTVKAGRAFPAKFLISEKQ